jgi:GNAT superfamily N-acetyltransferase
VNDLSHFGDVMTEEELQRQVEKPSIEPERDWWMVLLGERPVGCFRLFRDETLSTNSCDCSVKLAGDLSGAGDLVDRALDAVEARTLELDQKNGKPQKLHVYCADWLAACTSALERRGYKVCCREARLDRNDIDDLPQPEVLDGIAIRVFDPAQEKAGYINALNRAYSEDSTVPFMTEERFDRRFSSPTYRPELTFVARSEDEVVGTCSNWLRPRPERDGLLWGLVDDMAVLPEMRRRGIGRALLRHGMLALKAAGAQALCLWLDLDNPTGARQLYLSESFHVRRIVRNYMTEPAASSK